MATAHLLNNLLPLRSVQLGRIVRNANKPHQEFIDPLAGRPTDADRNRTPQTNFRETRRFTKSSKLGSYLSDILSISYKRNHERDGTLFAPHATTYELENSGQWFATACAEADTRRFLEESYDKQGKAYLVVGFRTVQDARMVQGATWTTTQTAEVDPESVIMSGIAASALVASIAAPTARFVRGAGNYQEVAYEAPGEQVFAVLYRKVRFRLLSSKNITNMSLEPSNRWVSCWDSWRGAEEDEEEEEEDVMEANLTDVSDVDEEYGGDGETDFVGRDTPDIQGTADDVGIVGDVVEGIGKRKRGEDGEEERSKRARDQVAPT